jgi:hypothetical protein
MQLVGTPLALRISSALMGATYAAVSAAMPCSAIAIAIAMPGCREQPLPARGLWSILV